MRILLDVDGVIADLVPTWLARYRYMSGERVLPYEITAYDFKGCVRDRSTLFKALATVDYAGVEPMPDAVQGVASLRAQGHTIRYVSHVPAKCPKHYGQKVEWLERYDPGFKPEDVIFCASGEKQYVLGDALVEDLPSTLASWGSNHPDGRLFLIEHPYNQGTHSQAIVRRASLLEVAHALRLSKVAA